MCGIFGYINYLVERDQTTIAKILVDGLKRLEYRGYDSAGLALDTEEDGSPLVFHAVGKVEQLESLIADAVGKSLDSSKIFVDHCGIAHTRWATHGIPLPENCHPQSSDENSDFLVVHNGIITNYRELKMVLKKRGYSFKSDTDTEVIAKLFKFVYDTTPDLDFSTLAKQVIQKLEGAFALLVKSVHYPGEAIATRRGSPLLVGFKSSRKLKVDFVDVVLDYGLLCEKQNQNAAESSDYRRNQSKAFIFEGDGPTPIEIFFASDVNAVIAHTKRVMFLEDDDVAHVSEGQLNVHRLRREDQNAAPTRAIHTLDMELAQVMKGSYDYFMEKEIYEQTESIMNSMLGRVNFDTGSVLLGGLSGYVDTIRKSRRIIFVASGTSYHSAIATRSLMEELTGIPCYVEIASDLLDRKPVVYRDDTFIFVSQSGETADSILVLKYCNERGAITIGITNTVGSSISRLTRAGVHVNAGSEIAVASTKAYTSQFVIIVLIALMLSSDSIVLRNRRLEIISGLQDLSKNISDVLLRSGKVKDICERFIKFQKKDLLLVGRGMQHATVLEGALKIKEVAYIHAEAISSGELKHGALALVDENIPIIFICTQDLVYEKVLNSFEQIRSRKGRLTVLCHEGTMECDESVTDIIEIPKTVDCLQGVLNVIPLQLMSFYLGVMQNHDVDCPKNLAKSGMSEILKDMKLIFRLVTVE